MSLFKRVLFFIITCLFCATLFADTFIVRHIEVQGLQRVSTGTVLKAMPLRIGEKFTDAKSEKIIAAIFKTGFFSQVNLARAGDTLVVKVVELPTIDSITITGNKSIKAEQLKPVLKKMGLVVGLTYDPSQLHAIVAGLEQEYALMGHPGATVTPHIKTLTRNRVAIDVVIQEGKAAIVKSIRFTGNKAFSQHQLRSQFKMTTSGLLTWFTHTDRYSSVHLQEDLQRLQEFYYDHGYLQFRVVSQKVTQLPKSNHVAIQVTVFEGPVFHISGYRIDATLSNNLLPPVKKIISQIKAGQVFSRKRIVDINKQIGDYLGDHGYAFPTITPIPQLNVNTHQVFLIYQITANHRVYVRKIHVVGNTRTSELVVRSQLRQMEGSTYSLKDINESKRRIQNLEYLNNIDITTTPVPDAPNQVDLDYHVHEVSAGRASVQGGYSDMQGFLYGASVSEPDFMGSGKYVALGFQNSAYLDNYSFNYVNPFYTVTGVSRGVSVYYSHMTPANVNMSPYIMDDYGVSMTYGIPMSEYDVLAIGGGYDHTAISNVNASLASPNVTSFLASNKSPFNQFKLITGITHSTLDRAIFPTAGNKQDLDLTVGAPILTSSLAYYQATYGARFYYPIGAGFIVNPHANVGYGDGYGKTKVFPFFQNFYAGGLDTLPGFEANTLGPKNPNNTSQAIGGNVQALGGINLILPEFISHKVRTALLLDAGNIYETNRISGINYESISPKNLRFTTGIMLSWWSPLGAPIDFSLAVPLNKKPGDQLALFGFSFGATI